jgi:hypothetical protein
MVKFWGGEQLSEYGAPLEFADSKFTTRTTARPTAVRSRRGTVTLICVAEVWVGTIVSVVVPDCHNTRVTLGTKSAPVRVTAKSALPTAARAGLSVWTVGARRMLNGRGSEKGYPGSVVAEGPTTILTLPGVAIWSRVTAPVSEEAPRNVVATGL